MLVVVIHEESGGPGFIETWCKQHENKAAIPTTYVNVYKNELLPPIEHVDGVIVLGGSMDLCERSQIPWLDSEISWLERIVGARIPTIGICLGAQILSSVLGGSVTEMETAEVGWQGITVHNNRNLGDWSDWLHGVSKVFLEHKYQFSIPNGAWCIASTEACATQGFHHPVCNVTGLQFHPEWTRSIAEQNVDNYELLPDDELLRNVTKEALYKLLDHTFVSQSSKIGLQRTDATGGAVEASHGQNENTAEKLQLNDTANGTT